jgi:hypothetical protein
LKVHNFLSHKLFLNAEGFSLSFFRILCTRICNHYPFSQITNFPVTRLVLEGFVIYLWLRVHKSPSRLNCLCCCLIFVGSAWNLFHVTHLVRKIFSWFWICLESLCTLDHI